MRCKNCGFENEKDIKFCENCGIGLTKNAEITENNEVKKGNNTALILILIILFTFVFIAVMTFVVYKVVFSEVKNDSRVKKYSNSSEVNNNTSSNTRSSNNTSSSNSVSGTVENETQVVGTTDFGYVSVPKNWYRFYDVESSGTFQYSYANAWIVTLYAVPTSQLDAYTYASNVKTNLSNENVTNLTGAKVKVAGYDAYQVYGYYSNENIWLVCWFFEGEDGKTHYIAVEGPDKTSEFFNIPDTFTLTR